MCFRFVDFTFRLYVRGGTPAKGGRRFYGENYPASPGRAEAAQVWVRGLVDAYFVEFPVKTT